MIAHRKRWWAWFALLPALLTTDVTAAETSVRLSLDYEIDGRAAPFLLPFDKGYYKAEGLNVTIDPASGSVETIERVASGNYEMGLADINALIKFRDTKRDAPIKAIFMLYNRPPFAVIGRKISKAKFLARRQPTALTRNGRSSFASTISMGRK